MSAMDPNSRPTIHVAQGEHAIGGDPSVVIGAVLGSCVAACIWDPEAHVGGMNHIILPEWTGGGIASEPHGASVMERLINALLRGGAVRGRLRAKVFGGANMIAGLPDIGRRNIEFLSDYLYHEQIPVDGSSLGGSRARMIRFWPYSGRARQRLVDRPPEVLRPVEAVGNDIELL